MKVQCRRSVIAKVCIVCLLFLQQGCGIFSQKSDPKSLVPKASKPGVVKFLNKCPMTDGVAQNEDMGATLLGIAIATLAPPLIEAATSGLSEWLEERANSHNASTTASTSANLWDLSEPNKKKAAVGCLAFIRGDFVANDPNPLPENKNGSWTSSNTNRINSELANSDVGIFLKSDPEMYIEFKLGLEVETIKAFNYAVETSAPSQSSGNGGAKTSNRGVSRATSDGKRGEGSGESPDEVKIARRLLLKPSYFVYLKSGTKDGGEEKRVVAETKLDVLVPGKDKVESKSLLDRPFDFGENKTPTVHDATDLLTLPSVELPIIEPYDEEVLNSTGDKILKIKNPVRMTATVVVTESEDKGDLERALAKSVKDNSKDLSKTVTDYLKGLVKKDE